MKGQGGQQGRKTNGVNGGRCWCEATNTHTHTHTQTHTHETADGGRPSLTYCVRTAESECTIPFSLDDGDQRNERRTTSAPIDTHTHTPARTYTHRHTRARTHTHTYTLARAETAVDALLLARRWKMDAPTGWCRRRWCYLSPGPPQESTAIAAGRIPVALNYRYVRPATRVSLSLYISICIGGPRVSIGRTLPRRRGSFRRGFYSSVTIFSFI